MIAGSSELAIRRQITDAPTSLTYVPLTDGRTAGSVNLQQELDTSASAAKQQVAAVAEVTSTGTNTNIDVVVTEDQATETGWLLCTILWFWVYLSCNIWLFLSFYQLPTKYVPEAVC